MGKWLERLATVVADEIHVNPPPPTLTKLPKPGSVSFGSAAAGGAAEFSVAPSPDPAGATPGQAPGSVSFVSARVGGAEEISSPIDDPRLARLLRWGWPVVEAEVLAARLARRDALAAAGDADDRVTCVECSNYRPGRCTRHRAAGLQSHEVGPDLAALPQRCAAFAPADAGPRTHQR